MNKIPVRIICFAGLRKYFGTEVTVNMDSDSSYAKVLDELKLLNPVASEILAGCRIAVNEEFVLPGELLKPENTLFLIPPSSGG